MIKIQTGRTIVLNGLTVLDLRGSESRGRYHMSVVGYNFITLSVFGKSQLIFLSLVGNLFLICR